jgi:D-sedoheptulose 7-phosphate isomerase
MPKRHFTRLLERYPELEECAEAILLTFEAVAETFASGGKLLLCGNGGSAADAEHIAGELLKGFGHKRQLPEDLAEHLGEGPIKHLQGSLPAIPLVSFTALSTAWLNDCDPDWLYAQLVYGLGREGDALLAISTSGNAQNVHHAVQLARRMGLRTLGLTGANGGLLAEDAEIVIKAPALWTPDAQELHLPIYHCLCLMWEEQFFPAIG